MPSLKIPVSNSDHMQGEASALVTLVEYGDYECPYCADAYPVVKRLQELYGSKLRFVFRNFPLTEMHPDALGAATTAEFAGEHGRFWEAHDALYENQQQLGLGLYDAIIAKLNLPVDELRSALEHSTYKGRIRNDFSGGVRSGVNGTPSFFINGERHNGPAELKLMTETIDKLIEGS